MFLRRSLGVAAPRPDRNPGEQPDIRATLGQYFQVRQEVVSRERAALNTLLEAQTWREKFDPMAERAMRLLSNQEPS